MGFDWSLDIGIWDFLMNIAEKSRIFFAKLQSLPEKKKKIILWAVVIILGLVMGFFWLRGAINSFSEIGESIKSINLPSTSILQTTTPSNK